MPPTLDVSTALPATSYHDGFLHLMPACYEDTETVRDWLRSWFVPSHGYRTRIGHYKEIDPLGRSLSSQPTSPSSPSSSSKQNPPTATSPSSPSQPSTSTVPPIPPKSPARRPSHTLKVQDATPSSAIARVQLDGAQIRAFTQKGLEVYLLKCGFGAEEAVGIAGDAERAKERERRKTTAPSRRRDF